MQDALFWALLCCSGTPRDHLVPEPSKMGSCERQDSWALLSRSAGRRVAAPGRGRELSSRPVLAVIVREKDVRGKVLLHAVISHCSMAVKSPRHREPPFVWAFLQLNTVVESSSDVVRSKTVVHLDRRGVTPGLAGIGTRRQASLALG